MKPGDRLLKGFNAQAKAIGPSSMHAWRVYGNHEMGRHGVPELDRCRVLGHRTGRTQETYPPTDLPRLREAVAAIP